MHRKQRSLPRDPQDFDDHQRRAVGHSKRRLRERVHLRVPDQAIINHGLLISFGQSVLLGVGGRRRELHKIEARGHLLYAVFDAEIRRIVTYLNSVAEFRGTLNSAGQAALRQKQSTLPTTEKVSVGPATAIGLG
jgi:hypothetical protein